LIEVRFQRGIYLPEPDLWLDPWDAKPHAFVSHAHADHFARHESVLCSETTALLLRHRFKLAGDRLETRAFHVPVVRDGFRIRLLPAGHIPGSAMLHIARIADNASLLYTGDFKTRRSRTSEPVNFLTADTLILETTFGLPGYEFPNPMEVEAEVMRFVQDCFSDAETPVLLAYSLGKAQEALALLTEHGIPVLLHPAAAAMTRACREAGVEGLPEPLEFDGHAPPGHVVIAPPNSVRTKLLRGLKAKRTAMLTGWALQPGAKYRYQVDAMIPFSDHADHPGLMECIQRVRPRQVLTVHGYAREFAAELRARRMDAWCASGGDQLELGIQRPAAQRPGTSQRAPWQKRVVCQLADFSDLCRLVSETGSLKAKTGFLAQYFAGLSSDEELAAAALWLVATSPGRSPGRATRLDLSSLRLALSSIPGARSQRFNELHPSSKDRMHTARVILQELQLRPEAMDLAQAGTFIAEFHANHDSMDRIQRLSNRLATLHPAEGESLLRLIAGELRLGIDPPLVMNALAQAFNQPSDEVRAAWDHTGDAGLTAMLCRGKRLSEATAGSSSHCTPSESSANLTTAELPFPEPH
jgi:DNA ligase 1